ncbi:MAG: branched-chain amino acid ABC transporter permease [Thermodesulfobacteriota bacterium]
MNYLLHLLIYLDIYIIVALSLNIVVGYCGLLTLAHAGYFAVGSYAYALLTLKLGWGFLPSVAAAAILSGTLSLAVSLPAWRLREDFFVMASLSVQALIFSAINNWSKPGEPVGTLANLTNGPYGVPGVPRPDIMGSVFDTIGSVATISLVLAFLNLLVGWALLKSPWGRVLQAMRDDELAARGLGKNVRRLKVQAFAVACGMVAVAGALYASYVNYVDASLSSLDHSILMLSMVIVGGVGNFRGPVVGAAVLIAIPEIMRLLQIPDTMAAEIRLMAYGLLLIVMMHLRPQGLAGSYRME